MVGGLVNGPSPVQQRSLTILFSLYFTPSTLFTIILILIFTNRLVVNRQMPESALVLWTSILWMEWIHPRTIGPRHRLMIPSIGTSGYLVIRIVCWSIVLNRRWIIMRGRRHIAPHTAWIHLRSRWVMRRRSESTGGRSYNYFTNVWHPGGRWYDTNFDRTRCELILRQALVHVDRFLERGFRCSGTRWHFDWCFFWSRGAIAVRRIITIVVILIGAIGMTRVSMGYYWFCNCCCCCWSNVIMTIATVYCGL